MMNYPLNRSVTFKIIGFGIFSCQTKNSLITLKVIIRDMGEKLLRLILNILATSHITQKIRQ